jgi:hypothetical protein
MTLPPEVAFGLLLVAMLAWMALPLIPAFSELLRPRDAAPLNAVGNDAGQLTFFAESFARRAMEEGLLGTMVPPRLADGSAVRAHSQASPIRADKKPIREVVVLMDSSPLPEGAELSSECLARLTLNGSASVSYRALLGQRDVTLGPRSTVLRWVHARGILDVAEGSQLIGRATSDRQITLAPDVTFQRMEAGIIRVVGAGAADVPPATTGVYERFEPGNADSMGPNYWRVYGDLTIPAGCALVGSVIATGDVVVQSGARVTGSLKAHGALEVQAGAIVTGSCAARARVMIRSGARVGGPIISEFAVAIEAAVVGSATVRTTVSAPTIRLLPGAVVYGAVMAAEDGKTTH